MPHYSTTRRVGHPAAKMFDLVADMEKYPQFVPLCTSLRVRSRKDTAPGVQVVVAEMTVAYKLIRQTFITRDTLDKPNLTILVEYLEGPFSHLRNRWIFHSVAEDSCEVEFYIDYEFKSLTLGVLMGAMFDTAFRKFATAFEQRADQVYGRKPTQIPQNAPRV
jgi:coenzyme Q-binding protein COQ10